MLYKGYSKELQESYANRFEKSKIIDYLTSQCGFERISFNTVVKQRFQDCYYLFFQDKKVILHYVVNNIYLDSNKMGKVAIELLKINSQNSMLNYGLDHNNIVCDHTFLLTPAPISEEAFIVSFERITDQIDSHRSEILQLGQKHTASFMQRTVDDEMVERIKSGEKNYFEDSLKQRLKSSLEDEIDSDFDDEDNDDDIYGIFDKEEIEEAIRNGEYYIEGDNDE